MFQVGDRIILENKCVGTLLEYLENNLWLVNFGQAGNFRIFENEMKKMDEMEISWIV